MPVASAPVRKRRGDRTDDPDLWIATLWLRSAQRDRIEDWTRGVRRATFYRPSISEVIRASLDAALDRLAQLGREDLEELASVLAGKSDKEAGPVAEEWIRQRLTATGREAATERPAKRQRKR